MRKLLLLTALAVSAAVQPRVYFEPTPLTLDNVGDSGSVEIKLSGAENISGYEFHLNFDPKAIHINGVEVLDAPSGVSIIPLGPDVDAENGSIAVGAFNFAGEDILAGATAAPVRIALTTLKEGTTELSFTAATLTNTDFQAVNVETSNGSVRTGVAPEGPEIALRPGWNRVTWPEGLADSTSLSALESIKADCGDAKISRMKGGWWESAVYGYGGANFNLSTGNSYLIWVTSTCSWTP